MSDQRLTPIIAGAISAPALVLDASISFWGGIDHQTGYVIDETHPQKGAYVGGTCLVVPMIRGSGSTPGALADILRRGCGPAGIVIGYPDINVMAGVTVASQLYGSECPLFHADQEQYAALKTGDMITIEENGQWRRE